MQIEIGDWVKRRAGNVTGLKGPLIMLVLAYPSLTEII